eukprot:TRINITY_DN3825_c0_g1_i1.p2 TRINITY_DN3825_c0_g1~~TRINITY_DN3825_c0_g1_i1.p2  ORF type:complete len:574 (+),score=100.24 TRINITY_DN3825_c0_g1_i1:62-1783(+)
MTSGAADWVLGAGLHTWEDRPEPAHSRHCLCCGTPLVLADWPCVLPYDGEEVCLLCGGRGHTVRTCPTPPLCARCAGDQELPRRCVVCGGRGHDAESCTSLMCTRCRSRGHDASECPQVGAAPTLYIIRPLPSAQTIGIRCMKDSIGGPLFVSDVVHASPAEKSGVPLGANIVAINGVAVDSEAGVVEVVDAWKANPVTPLVVAAWPPPGRVVRKAPVGVASLRAFGGAKMRVGRGRGRGRGTAPVRPGPAAPQGVKTWTDLGDASPRSETASSESTGRRRLMEQFRPRSSADPARTGTDTRKPKTPAAAAAGLSSTQSVPNVGRGRRVSIASPLKADPTPGSPAFTTASSRKPGSPATGSRRGSVPHANTGSRRGSVAPASPHSPGRSRRGSVAPASPHSPGRSRRGSVAPSAFPNGEGDELDDASDSLPPDTAVVIDLDDDEAEHHFPASVCPRDVCEELGDGVVVPEEAEDTSNPLPFDKPLGTGVFIFVADIEEEYEEDGSIWSSHLSSPQAVPKAPKSRRASVAPSEGLQSARRASVAPSEGLQSGTAKRASVSGPGRGRHAGLSSVR